MLIINIEGMLAGAVIGGLYFLMTMFFPSMEYPARYMCLTSLFLVIGTIADILGYQPKIYYAKFKLVGIILTILGAFIFLGAAMFFVTIVLSVIGIFLWKRNMEYKIFLRAQSLLTNYLANEIVEPQARKRALLEALFQNIWLNKKPEFFTHNEKVLDLLLSDTNISRNEDEAHYLGYVRDRLLEQKIQTKWFWRLQNIGVAKRSLTNFLDNQGIGRFRPVV